APELASLIVRYPPPPAPPMPEAKGEASLRGHLATAPMSAPAPAPQQVQDEALRQDNKVAATERDATIEVGGYQVVFRIPGRISVATNEGAKAFRVASATIAPDLLSRATPALDETAYLEASFKQGDDAPLLPGRVALYRDGIFVGRGQMALIP